MKWFKKENKCNSEYELSVSLKCVNNDEFADEEFKQITHWTIKNKIFDEKYEILMNQKTMYNTSMMNTDSEFNYYNHDNDNTIRFSRLNYLLRKLSVINNDII